MIKKKIDIIDDFVIVEHANGHRNAHKSSQTARDDTARILCVRAERERRHRSVREQFVSASASVSVCAVSGLGGRRRRTPHRRRRRR